MSSLLIKLGYWLTPGTTSIDRTKCSRTVPMEVLVLGLSRTGTTSIGAALKQLGYDHVYHMNSISNINPRDAEMWAPAYRAKYHGEGKIPGRAEFDQLLGHCMAVSDVPCIHFAKELIEAYPNAKVVLSIRDSPEAWLKSVQSTLIPVTMRLSGYSPWARFKKLFTPTLPFEAATTEMLIMTGESHEQALQTFKHTTTDEYTSHCNRIRMLVRQRNERLIAEGRASEASDLLEYNVKSGWRPLCNFLGKPVPQSEAGEDQPFPRLNDTKEFLTNTGMASGLLQFLIYLNMFFTAFSAWAVVKLVLRYGPVGRAYLGL